MSECIQNKIKQKLNLHNKEEYQSLADERIIASLEKEMEFLTTNISTKSYIVTKFLNNNTYKNNNDNIAGETRDFGCTFNTSDSQSALNAGKKTR